jgi:hypothetical protein
MVVSKTLDGEHAFLVEDVKLHDFKGMRACGQSSSSCCGGTSELVVEQHLHIPHAESAAGHL